MNQLGDRGFVLKAPPLYLSPGQSQGREETWSRFAIGSRAFGQILVSDSQGRSPPKVAMVHVSRNAIPLAWWLLAAMAMLARGQEVVVLDSWAIDEALGQRAEGYTGETVQWDDVGIDPLVLLDEEPGPFLSNADPPAAALPVDRPQGQTAIAPGETEGFAEKPGTAPDGNAAPGASKSKKQTTGESKEAKKDKADGPKKSQAEPAKKVEPKPTYPNVRVNGVFQADAAFFSQDFASELAHGPIQDGANFRRARLSAIGAVTERVNYYFQMDFGAFGRPTFTDVWVEQTGLPLLGNVRVGQWKHPFSLEVVSSFRYTTFLERSLLFIPFTPFRHIGAGFYDHSENLRRTWAFSGFRTGQDQFGGSISTDGGWGTSGRATWCPWWDEYSNGRGYLHLGGAHFYSNPPNDRFNFRTIPEFFVGEQAPDVVGTSGVATPGPFNGVPFFAETGPLVMENGYHVLGSELLWVNGPLSLQSEAMIAMGELQNGESFAFPGVYAQVGYFLTGEHRPYDRKLAVIDRVIPYSNFMRHCDGGCLRTGPGAWEIAGRISHLNLNDGTVRGGEMTNLTAGLNWYTTPYTKFVFNWIHVLDKDPTVGPNDTDIFAVRVQTDF